MKRGKRLLAILLVLILSVSMAGCSKFAQQNQSASDTTSSKKMTLEDVKKRVINEASEYLKKNYPDDNFTFVSAASPNWADNYYKVGFKTEKYNNQQVMVYGSSSDKKDEDGFTIYTYSDDYYQYYMKDDAEKYFIGLAEKYIDGTINVNITFETAMNCTKQIDNKLDFYQNLSRNQIYFNLCFIYDGNLENKKDSIELFLKKIVDIRVYTLIWFKYKKENSNKYDGFLKYKTYDGIIEEVNN